MTDELTAGDVLTGDWVAVDPFHRYRDVVPGRPGQPEPTAFAVVEGDRRFRGLVEATQAALFPGRIFADLLQGPTTAPVRETTPLAEVITRLTSGGEHHLPVVADDGTLAGVIARGPLFAELMERERSLRREREELVERLEAELDTHRIAAAVFQATSEGIMVTDARARILRVNPAFERTTGYPVEEGGLVPPPQRRDLSRMA
ncbi:PAS domain-containing protein, partial [Thiohalospira sp.]|uniref:PAS domain-containing protein n=1 Tax=Thiohalospira sp. TaxID=3080549 RepID=UPI00397F8FDF